MTGAAPMVTRLDGTVQVLEGPSCKLQAASGKLPNIFSFIKIRETRGEGLY